MAVAGWHQLFAHRRRSIAVAVSLALHGSMLYALSQMEIPREPEKKRPYGRVVWLSDWQLPAPTVTPEPLNAAVEQALEPESQREEPLVAVDEKADAEEAEPHDPPPIEAPQANSEAPPDASQADAETPRDAAVPDENSRSPQPNNTLVDEFGNRVTFEQLQQSAVANVVSHLNQQSNFVAFSQEDSLVIAPLSGPPAQMSVFDAPDSPKASLLSPNKARSKAGRWIGELCNALTGGGFGFMGLSMCAEGEIYGKMFAHLKPDYMRKRPVCVDTATGSADILAASAEETQFSTIKCRLVEMDEWGLIDLDRAAEEAALARQ